LARNASKLKLSYYPLAEREGMRIRRFLQFAGAASVLDPCAGTGAALRTITDGAEARRYGIELDAYRAAEAKKILDEVIHGSVFETHSPVESYTMLYLNPPYDHEIGEGKNQRLEQVFLEHTFRWLKPGGVLVMIVPFDRVNDCRGVLTPQFRDKTIYRLNEPEAAAYKQVAVLCVRRSRQERERLTDFAVQQGNHKLRDLTRLYEEIPAMPDSPDRMFAVPMSEPAKLDYRGLPLDTMEDLLASSPGWLQAQRVTHAPKAQVSGRPLIPLHRGHVGLLCTSSLLNGRFGQGKDLHLSFWESVKVVDKVEEDGASPGAMVIRERERFSQRLTLLYGDGRFALLSEKANGKEGEDAKRAPQDGDADVCETNA
jgi:tRNA1(Val) A37 N6-methylase TrmN6